MAIVTNVYGIAESLRRLLSERRAAADADSVRAESARRARRAADLRTVEAAQQGRRDETEAKARAVGFASMTEAIEQTRRLTIGNAAARIGVGLRTVARWRRREPDDLSSR